MICLVSDTHDNTAMVRTAIAEIKKLSPSLVIHCGDITAPETLELFAGLPLRCVFGNCDFQRADLRAMAHKLGFGEILDSLTLSIEDKDFLITHGTNLGKLEDEIESQVYDYVCHGHTHRQRNQKVGRTLAINPGALSQAYPLSFATLDVTTAELTFHTVED